MVTESHICTACQGIYDGPRSARGTCPRCESGGNEKPIAPSSNQRSTLQQILAKFKEADDERYRNQMEFRADSLTYKAEGDMYGYNFHAGMDAGANWVALYFFRVQRELEALIKATPDETSDVENLRNAVAAMRSTRDEMQRRLIQQESEIDKLRAALIYSAFAQHKTPQHMLPEGIALINSDAVEVTVNGVSVYAGPERSAEEPRCAPLSEDQQFTHDCERCKFLGVFHHHDLYYCLEGGEMPTVIARYGSEGPNYKSGIPAAAFDPELSEAKRRAEELGLRVTI